MLNQVYYYPPKGKFTTIDVPSKATALFTQARGITNDGRIVGYYVANGRYHGFDYYKKGKFSTIDVPDATLGPVLEAQEADARCGRRRAEPPTKFRAAEDGSKERHHST